MNTFLRLLPFIYGFALLGAAVYLFTVFGPSGWLFVVLLLVLVLAVARPAGPS